MSDQTVPMPTPASIPRKPRPLSTDQLKDMSIGVMIEGPYGWHEYCLQHGTRRVLLQKTLRHRTVSAWEANNAWRAYMCAQCRKHIYYTED